MVARLALSTSGVAGQYVGTTRASTPNAAPGSSTCRQFNGTSDRLVLGRSSDLGATFLLTLTFWRADSSVLANDQTAGRLFTQYSVGGTRVAIGLNRDKLSITYMESNGNISTAESLVNVADTGRHFLGLLVTSTTITAFLDGREAIKVSATLASPDTARVVVGADGAARFFSGYIDDLAVFKTPTNKPAGWLRYYRDLALNRFRRDFTAAGWAQGVNQAVVNADGYVATGYADQSRVPCAQPFRTEAELPEQHVEFRLGAGTGELRLGVFETSQHSLAASELGETDYSFAFLPAGQLRKGAAIQGSTPLWSEDDILAFRWQAGTRTLSLLVNGTSVHQLTLPAGTWAAALSIGTRAVTINAGHAPWLSLAPEAPGLPLQVWSQMTTEFRHMKLAEVCAPLDEATGAAGPVDAYSGAQIGTYYNAVTPEAGISGDSFDVSRRLGAGILISAAAYTAADTDFFFAIAFSPEIADLTGERVLLECPDRWGLKLVDGRLVGWVGSVQVGSTSTAVEAGGRYLVGIGRSASGNLLVWCHLGYILQSNDIISTQTQANVWVGSKSGGTASAFTGRLSHLVLASKLPPAWKMDRLRYACNWDEPNIEGAIPTPATVREVFEMSYRDVVATGVDTAPAAGDCFVGALGRRPDAISVEYRLVDRMGADEFLGEFLGDWAPEAALSSGVGRFDTVLLLDSFSGFEAVQVGDAVRLGEEICRVVSTNAGGSALTVARGCADTLPAAWPAGTRVWTYGASTLASTHIPYLAGDTIEVKMLSRTELAELADESAPTDTLTMAGRASRPYPPGNVTVNGELEPVSLEGTVQVAWKHRHKVGQGSSLVAWAETFGAAPTSVTYRVRAYDAATSALLHESSALASTVDTYDLLVEHTGELGVTVTSYENGLACAEVPALSFDYTDEVTVLMATELGEAVDLEDGTHFGTEGITAVKAASYSGELPDDWAGLQAAETPAGGGSIIGVKVSEMPNVPTPVIGSDIAPLVRGGENYKVTFQDFLDFVAAGLPQAQDGKDAYQSALDAGFEGTEAEWLASLQGPQGLSSNQSRRIQTIDAGEGAIVCDWGLYDEIRILMVGPLTLTFTGARDGQGCLLKLKQDSTGGRPVEFTANIRYNVLIQQYNPSPGPGLIDKVGFIYDSSDSAYDLVSLVPGISS